MPSEDYEEGSVASDREDDSYSNAEEEEDESESEAEQEPQSSHPSHEEAEDEVDYDALDDTPAPKPFPKTISLVLPQRASASVAREPTCVHVCLTRGIIGQLHPRGVYSKRRDSGEEGDEEVTADRGSAGEEVEEEEADSTSSAAAQLQGCCAVHHQYENDYAAPLAALRRRLILRHLHGDAERQRRFLVAERARERRELQSRLDDGADGKVEDGDGGEVAEEDGSTDPLEGVLWPWTTMQKPPPYWLPALLSNDVHTFQRVLHIMYGWIIAPEPHPADQLRIDAAGRLCTGKSSPAGAEESDEDAELADSTHHSADYFLASGAFLGDGLEEESEEASSDSAAPAPLTSKSLLGAFNACEVGEEEHPSDEEAQGYPDDLASAGEPSHSRVPLSVSTAPPPVAALPHFPFTEYEFFIVYDKASEEWHLLDTHPYLVMEACRRRREEQLSCEGGQPEDEFADGADLVSDDEAASEADSEGEAKAKSSCHVPVYAMDSIIPVSPIVLAALFSPAALRCCLLQPLHAEPKSEDDPDEAEGHNNAGGAAAMRSVSPLAVLQTFDHAWLSVDTPVALPILATICRARQRALQQDALRIPYPLGNLWIDANPLYALPAFTDVFHVVGADQVRRWRAPPGQHPEEDDKEGVDSEVAAAASPVKAAELSSLHRWGTALDSIVNPGHYGRLVLTSLLDAGLLPTRPVELGFFRHLSLLRLALWWWMRLPPKLIRQWGVNAAADERVTGDDADTADNGAEMPDEEEESDADEEVREMAVEDATEFLQLRIEKLKARDASLRRRSLRKEHPTLVFTPLLQRVLLELQRRLDRINAVDARGVPVAPSQYTLQESVARTYVAERLESGHPRQDPLVTTAFIGLANSKAAAFAAAAPETPVAAVTTGVAHAATVRHQRLYQSDLVLLLLALTTTPAPLPSRVAMILDDAEHRFTSIADENTSKMGDANVREAQHDDVDAHTALFSHLLELKTMRRVRRPQDRTRAGTTKLLLLCSMDFCRGATRQRVFEKVPPFELFGSTGYCSLTDLVQAWSSTSCRHGDGSCSKKEVTVQLFAYYMWNEIRWRLRKEQYSEAAVSKMREQLPELFELVEAHSSTYDALLARLGAEASAGSKTDDSGGGPLSASAARRRTSSFVSSLSASGKHGYGSESSPTAAAQSPRPSLMSSAVLQVIREEIRDEVGLAPTTASLPLTLDCPNAYSVDVLDSKARVTALWQSFEVAPHTYMTAETLHTLLFAGNAHESGDTPGLAVRDMGGARRFHTAALSVMFENGITTVQACPLDGPEIPAIEVALQRADLPAVKLLLGLGAASLQDTCLNGGATLESWAEKLFRPSEMGVLRFIARKNTRVMRSDPRLHFGARRFGSVVANS
ncbi:hypothetical protein LSCM1_02607 [Leishmania martiniquensis]|uniref:Uncharacterized protein n=1 Tax=Leishmania martiniquensis TaxID=1580590 RepID=A0A836H2W1_9TRYP|nr:hypothetical protein LSCM1_02607 [Leishmania martiniquensis]